LHRTLETSTFLLEFIPGQDFLQARGHHDVDPAANPVLTHTPPTPGLLSSLRLSQLLSHTSPPYRLYVFAQMCEAVATCHDASVFHRDIKPKDLLLHLQS
jgi:serine/threonine protein kinase